MMDSLSVINKNHPSLTAQRWLTILLLMGWFCSLKPACLGQETIHNGRIQALELDGDGDFVLLPYNAFSNLDTTTVETWVKCNKFQTMSRVFGFTLRNSLINLHNRNTDPNLWASQYRSGMRQSLQLPGALPSNEWVHLAMVVQSDSVNIILNGTILFDRFITDNDTFQSEDFSKFNMLGRGNARVVWRGDQDFQGQIAEFRVWDHARSLDEIKSQMSTRLKGSETGLVALYNF